MKQLTIFCSSDLANTVRDALVRAGLQGFLKVPHAVGSKPAATWQHGRYPTWDAEMFIAPAEEDETDRVVAELKGHAGKCEVEPCLRILITPLDAVY
jgi:hypothetical protein